MSAGDAPERAADGGTENEELRQPGRNGGWLWRGDGGGQRQPDTGLGALKRVARRHLAELEGRAFRVANRALQAAENEQDAAAAVAKLKPVGEAMRIIASIAEPTRAEDAREDLSAPHPLTIFVRTDQTPPPPHRPAVPRSQRKAKRPA